MFVCTVLKPSSAPPPPPPPSPTHFESGTFFFFSFLFYFLLQHFTEMKFCSTLGCPPKGLKSEKVNALKLNEVFTKFVWSSRKDPPPPPPPGGQQTPQAPEISCFVFKRTRMTLRVPYFLNALSRHSDEISPCQVAMEDARHRASAVELGKKESPSGLVCSQQ